VPIVSVPSGHAGVVPDPSTAVSGVVSTTDPSTAVAVVVPTVSSGTAEFAGTFAGS